MTITQEQATWFAQTFGQLVLTEEDIVIVFLSSETPNIICLHDEFFHQGDHASSLSFRNFHSPTLVRQNQAFKQGLFIDFTFYEKCGGMLQTNELLIGIVLGEKIN